MVGCAGLLGSAGFLDPGKPTLRSPPPARLAFGGGLFHIKEAAAMLATTPTQNPQFIWLIAAVRRDMPTITAKIHPLLLKLSAKPAALWRGITSVSLQAVSVWRWQHEQVSLADSTCRIQQAQEVLSLADDEQKR
jgi:hypothetical protein